MASEQTTEADLESVHLPADLMHKARVIASFRKTTLRKLLAEMVRGPIERTYRREVESAAELGGEAG